MKHETLARDDPVFIAWDLHYPSPEEAAKGQDLLQQRTNLDGVMFVTRQSSRGVEEIRHRTGDYFEEVLILPAPQGDRRTVRVIFHRYPPQWRNWKDIMVWILHAAAASLPEGAVKLAYRGDEGHDWKSLPLA
jgi:hypothetical protein